MQATTSLASKEQMSPQNLFGLRYEPMPSDTILFQAEAAISGSSILVVVVADSRTIFKCDYFIAFQLLATFKVKVAGGIVSTRLAER